MPVGPTFGHMRPERQDTLWMGQALALARSGMGQTWPNPSVGCVIVKSSSAIGQACTAPGGRPHAETLALRQAGDDARGATAYVTLEPCSHFGVTSPCSAALAEAGLQRVVVAVRDPDPRVNGLGIAQLVARGLRVDLGVCAAQAKTLIAGFAMRVSYGRPLVSLWHEPAGKDPAAKPNGWHCDATLASVSFALARRHDYGRFVHGLRVLLDLDVESPRALVADPPPLPAWLLLPSRPREAAELRRLGIELCELACGGHQPDAKAADTLARARNQGSWNARGRLGRAALGTALAALGARGLTHVGVHELDPLAAQLKQRQLVP